MIKIDHPSFSGPSDMAERVLVALSGGVDSAVAAWKLQSEGYEVEGIHMHNWDETSEACTATVDAADALKVGDILGIPVHQVRLVDTYWQDVFAVCLRLWERGQTPNPDILCNRHVKFKALLEHARLLGFPKLATGHYARLQRDARGRSLLFKGVDPHKDQSYFLYAVDPSAWSQVLFPLGEAKKTEVRAWAQAARLPNYDKKDSTGICFVGERNMPEFLKRFLTPCPGEIQTVDGQVLGRHEGLMFYTLGQRKGLHLGGIRGQKEAPWYVYQKRTEDHVLVVGQDPDHPLLMRTELMLSELHWIDAQPPILPLQCEAKVRYQDPGAPASLSFAPGEGYRLSFLSQRRALTPGQSAVLYQGDRCLGGGIITEVL